MINHSFIKIIIVIIEFDDNNKFQEFINKIYHIHKFNYIIFDEIHKLSINTRYHHEIAEIRNLSFSIQFLFLSTIFSSQFEKLYKKKILIKEFKYIYNFIYKKNVKYIMKIMKKDDIQLSIFQFIKSMINKYKEKRKILRFYKIY